MGLIALTYAGAVLALVLAGLSWVRRDRYVPVPLVGAGLCAAFWAFGYARELGSRDLETALFWANLQYLGVFGVLPFVGAFVLRFIQRERRDPPVLLAIGFGLPVLTTLTAFTNDWHQLWRPGTPTMEAVGPLMLVQTERGPAFFTAYAIVLLIYVIVAARLIGFLSVAPTMFVRHALVILAGMTLPVAGNALYVFDLPWLHGYDPTPVLVTLGIAMWLYVILRMRMLEVMPIARALVFEAIQDGVVVLDNRGCIVDLNPSAERLLGLRAERDCGQVLGSRVPALGNVPMGGEPQSLSMNHAAGRVDLAARRSSVGKWGSVVVVSDETRQRAAERTLEAVNEQLRLAAQTDALTGLANYRELRRFLESSVQSGSTVMVLIDCDRFKALNDQHGHLTGDHALVLLASMMKSACPPDGLAARYGGEEFALVLPGRTIEEGVQTAELLRRQVAAIRSLPCPLTISAGVARVEPKGDAVTLIRDADSALYQSKREGRNRVTVAGEMLQAACEGTA